MSVEPRWEEKGSILIPPNPGGWQPLPALWPRFHTEATKSLSTHAAFARGPGSNHWAGKFGHELFIRQTDGR